MLNFTSLYYGVNQISTFTQEFWQQALPEPGSQVIRILLLSAWSYFGEDTLPLFDKAIASKLRLLYFSIGSDDRIKMFVFQK